MKNVSNEFRKTMNTRTDFYMESDVVFADGTEKELTRENFYLSGNSYTDAAGSSSFPLGVALEKQIQISLVNDKEQFSTYDFYGAKFTVYCCLDLDSGVPEKILLGTFTVTEPETYGSVITVTAVDDLYKGDKDYSTGLTFPMTAGQALRDSCSTCGVTLLDTTFTNDDYVIAEMPEGITHRALWGQCAMLAGGNARMDEYNRLRIISYDFSLFDRAGLNGGVFDADNPYSSGDTADGGFFDPWDVGAVIDGGTFNEAKDYHVFWKAKNLTVATDDVVITGIQTTVDDETYRFGEEGYILSLTNQLIEGNPQDAVNRIGALIVGARFRPFSMDHTAYPLAEVGDVCFVVDRKQNTYQAIVTDVNFTFFGFTTLQCQADSPIRNSSKYNSQLTQAIVQARLNTQKQITEYDRAVQQLTSLITQSFGVYKTEEVLEDGSTVYYMHNKPTLAESQTIWKMTADAFAVSTDNGTTWNAGMDSEGNAVVNVLSAIGINFEWARGGTLSLGGSGNGNGVLRIYNSNNAQVGYIDNTGVHFNQGSFAGSLSAATGTFKGNLSAAGGTFSGNLSAAGGTFTGTLQGADGTFSGKLSAATGTFKGELQAATGTFAGSLSAATGTFKGSLSAATGSFSGQVTASSGSIGGLIINSSGITVPDSAHGIYLGSGGSIGSTQAGYQILQCLSGQLGVNLAAPGGILYLGYGGTGGVPETGAIMAYERLVNAAWEDFLTSDKRLKTDISKIENMESYNFMMKLTPSRFRFIDNPESIHHGLIAQDVLKEISEDWGIVYEYPHIERKTGRELRRYALSYTGLIADIIGALQYIGKKVEGLDGKAAIN